MTKICICGGGSLGHVCAGILGTQNNVEVNVLTQRPQLWAKQIIVKDNFGKEFIGKLNVVSSDYKEALSNCDIVFLCLPGFAIEETLKKIKPLIGNAIIGSIVCSTGFFFFAHEILDKTAKLFGFQRVPFIARTSEYGKSAKLLGYKDSLNIATENIDDCEAFRKLVEKLWLTPTILLNSYYEVSLTNSNPILHTGRLFSMWKDWNSQVYDHNILFYKEWTIEASRLLIEMDSEFMALLSKLPVKQGAIPSLLEYYESTDAQSLTKKISTIPAFQEIVSPMKQVEKGWIPDFSSRYFTEDFPFGLKHIVELAQKHHVDTPTLNMVYQWGMSVCEK